MAVQSQKSDQAFRTIGELAAELGIPQHILRYWETRFPQLKPLQRAGNRRYYRPDDVLLARRIHRLLNQDGYTIRGVQQLLARGDEESSGQADTVSVSSPDPGPEPASAPAATVSTDEPGPAAALPLDELKAIRRLLAEALLETSV